MRMIVIGVLVFTAAMVYALAQASGETTLQMPAVPAAQESAEMTLVAYLRLDGVPLKGAVVDFAIDGASLGSALTDSAGVAQISWLASGLGAHEATAIYLGDKETSAAYVSTKLLVRSAEAIQALEECTTVFYDVFESRTVPCTKEDVVTVCADPIANTSCTQEVTYTETQCAAPDELVTKTREDCVTNGYLVGSTKIDTRDYACSATADTLLCDSRYDGNGDGVCTSGETCLRYTLNADETMDVSVRNSKDDFRTEEKSFFLEKPTVEVFS